MNCLSAMNIGGLRLSTISNWEGWANIVDVKISFGLNYIFSLLSVLYIQ